MTQVTTGSAWSAAIGPTTFDCPIQCQEGFARITWKSGADPATVFDGFLLGPGESLVLPAGSSWKHVNASPSDTPAVLYYLEFTVA